MPRRYIPLATYAARRSTLTSVSKLLSSSTRRSSRADPVVDPAPVPV